MRSKTPLLKVTAIHKLHDGSPTLKGVDLSLFQGEILCLLGPSGCGKTTLLRIIAGLEQPNQGQISFDNVDLAPIPPYRRKFSMMFQEFALFPHKNVFDNIAFGLQMQKLPAGDIKTRTEEMIELVGLVGKEERDIGDLSGGERQRVALARSLAPRPRLLMLDEPMGSLDRALRERLILDLRQILKKVDVTTIFVTHDQNEAFVLADRIAVFNKGYIEQVGTPEELFKRPGSEFVARFLGFQNLLTVKMNADGSLNTLLGVFTLPDQSPGLTADPLLLIRPESARIITDDALCLEQEIAVQARILDCRFQGAIYQVQVSIADATTLVFHLPSESPLPQPGDVLPLALNTSAMSLLNNFEGRP